MEKHKHEKFTFFASYFDVSLDMVNYEEIGRFFSGVIGYGLDDIEPEFDSPLQRTAWRGIKPNMDKSRQRRENGEKGGAPMNNNNACKEKQPKNNQKTTKKQPKNNQKTTNKNKNKNNEYEEENENEIEKEVEEVNSKYAIVVENEIYNYEKQIKILERIPQIESKQAQTTMMQYGMTEEEYADACNKFRQRCIAVKKMHTNEHYMLEHLNNYCNTYMINKEKEKNSAKKEKENGTETRSKSNQLPEYVKNYSGTNYEKGNTL